MLKRLGRYASLNHNIYNVEDSTPVDLDHAAHAFHCIVRIITHNIFNATVLSTFSYLVPTSCELKKNTEK